MREKEEEEEGGTPLLCVKRTPNANQLSIKSQ